MEIFKLFTPIQPEWHKSLQSLQISKVSAQYQSSIAYVYKFKTKIVLNENVQLPGIPDGCIDLIFNLEGILSECFLIPSPKKRVLIDLKADSTYLGIRLYPHQKLFLFQISLKELNSKDSFLLFDVAPNLLALYELLLRTFAFKEQIQKIESFLLTYSSEADHHSAIFNCCLNKIILQRGNLQVKDLEQYSGYSERYLRIIFHKELGIPPKTFIQLVNFQFIINDIVKGGFLIKNHLADNLYYDSSHFYKTFKKFTDMTPGEYSKILFGENCRNCNEQQPIFTQTTF